MSTKHLLPIAGILACAAASFAPASAQGNFDPPDHITIGLQLEPPSLDPTTGPAEAIRDVVYENVFEGLTRIDEHNDIHPLLAKSWTATPDGKRYDFTLQTKAAFTDGEKFDCATVKFSLDRARAPGSINPERNFFSNVTDIACPAPDHAVITLSAPDSEFLYHLAWASSAIVAPGSVAHNAQHPIGTGPYVFTDWKRGDSITLTMNDHYWGVKPTIHAVVFRFISDPLTAANALESGALDGFVNFPAYDMLARFRNDPKFQLLIGTSPIKLIWALNEARPPFNDLRVREALAEALDRKAIASGAAEGLATPIGSHDTPNDPNYFDLSARPPYDPDRAQALLREAGVAPGTTIEITLPPTDYARRTGELISAFLAQVGLNAKLVPVQWPQWLSQVYGQANYQTTVIAHTEPQDLDIYARPHYYFGYHDAEYDALFARYRATLDPIQRRELSHQLQARLADTQANVFIAAMPHISVWSVHIHGAWRDEPIPLNRLAELSWSP